MFVNMPLINAARGRNLKKQEQIRKKKVERQQVKAAKENLLRERESEKVKLEEQEKRT
mgnify:CR=1 FL=1